jgi:NTE family protein
MPIEPTPESGVGLCLSGGGYRAMLFHVGALWRLNEAGYLPSLDRVSSVSGGSITAGVLAQGWTSLEFDSENVAQAFGSKVVEPIRRLAGRTLDARAIATGVALPRVSVGDRIVSAYRDHLFGTFGLQDLPDTPRFVFNATNLQSGALWRMEKRRMRDWRVGEVPSPRLDLATAVAASSAFPPFLSPVVLDLAEDDYTPATGVLQRAPFTTRVFLSDGGVYDNLGLETVWKRCRTVLVSDGGGHMKDVEAPSRLWPLQTLRVLAVIDNQVRNLRKRWVLDAFRAGDRSGTYWGIRTDIGDYELQPVLPCPYKATMELAEIPTRLEALDPVKQERLINWGYAVSDAALRRYVDPELPAAPEFPYSGSGVG